jgi:hypothetical protein
MRLLALLVFARLSCVADAQYQLAYQVKASPLIAMASAAAGIEKLESAGETVYVKGARIAVHGKKSTLVMDYAKDVVYVVDHMDKTFEKHTQASFQQQVAAEMPSLATSTLRKFFPAEGASLTPTEVKVEQAARGGSMAALEAFHNAHGLGYLLPGANALLPLAPGLAVQVRQLQYEGVPTRLRFRIGQDGKFVDAFVEVRGYEETTVAEGVFLPPPGYTQVEIAVK